MDLLERFRDFLESGRLIPADGPPLLLAVSGGLDSVVMAHLFRRLGRPFAIAHCNFQLRGTESDEDALFVGRMAESWAVPFYVKHFDTKTYAAAQGLSTQVAARVLRYAWFEELCAQDGYQIVATAHHLNDSTETLVLHFARGTGIRGLQGIPLKNAQVLRPLLFAKREEIRAYADANHIEWREDSSNASEQYTRNFIRHQIMPLLQEINPDFLHSAKKMMHRMGELEEITTFLLDGWLREKGRPESGGTLRLAISDLQALPHTAHSLFLILEKKGFSAEQCRQLAEALHGQPGFEIGNDQFRALIDRHELIVAPLEAPLASVPIQEDDLMLTLPDGAKLMLVRTAATPPYPDGKETVLVDVARLRFPLRLRGWEAGDTFQPLGMNGQSQKLQDYFTNLKLSRLEKERVWLLVNGDGDVIWVLGHRPDERFKIRNDDAIGLKISYLR